MADLTKLYREVIMEHYKNPLNKGLTHKDNCKFLHLSNPSCGDEIDVEIYMENGLIKDIRHDGHGCSISSSSASVMTEVLKGKTKEEALRLCETFFLLVEGKEISEEEKEELGEAVVYEGVSKFPARIKCATLAWKAAERILRGDSVEE